MKNTMKIVMALLVMFSVNKVFSQEWVVAQADKDVQNPSAYNRQNVKEGKALYMTDCKSCHGDPGMNNALALNPPPPDITSQKMLANTEGEIFFKITHGKDAMPAFENTLSVDERWKVINFMKKFDPKNAGIVVDDEPIKAKLQASVDEATSVISVSAQAENKNGEYLPLAGATVFVKVKKTFGGIVIGNTVTNEQGLAEYAFPKDYQGDAEGKIDLLLNLNDDYAGNVVEINRAKISAVHEPENLFKDKVLWSTNDKTEIWLILSYLLAVIGVWSVIGYIVFMLFKIKKAGK